jgi:hypothetical protein
MDGRSAPCFLEHSAADRTPRGGRIGGWGGNAWHQPAGQAEHPRTDSTCGTAQARTFRQSNGQRVCQAFRRHDHPIHGTNSCGCQEKSYFQPERRVRETTQLPYEIRGCRRTDADYYKLMKSAQSIALPPCRTISPPQAFFSLCFTQL